MISHSELVELAAKWLRKKHSVVLTELATTGEEPDAIGWQGTHSTLVECKASRSDFLCDKQKPFRMNPQSGIGQQRYFLCVPGVINESDLPNGWGLLVCFGDKIRRVRESDYFECNHRQEIGILLSTLKRIGHNAPSGVSIRCYTITTENRATLTIEEPAQEAK